MKKPWIYLAGPLFTRGEIAFNQQLTDGLRAEGYRVYLPQQECSGVTEANRLYEICILGLEDAAAVLVILDGADADSGSCFEVGYAYAQGIPVVGLRTDFRGSGEHMGVNLMLTHSCTHLLLTSHTPLQLGENFTQLKPEEDFLPKLLVALEAVAGAQKART